MCGRSQKSVQKSSAEIGMQGDVHPCSYPQVALLLYSEGRVASLGVVCDCSGSPRVRAMTKGQDCVPFRPGVPKIRSPILL